MSEKIFLFGAGNISNNYTKILEQLPIEVYGYIDNDAHKWGGFLRGKKIYPPEILNQIEDSLVIIACSDIKGVTIQLCQMGMKTRIVSLEHIIRGHIQKLKIEEKYEKNYYVKLCKQKTIIIDNLDGKWGGAEDWAHKIALLFLNRGYTTIVIENTDSKPINGLEECTIQIEKKEKDICKVYLDLVDILMKKRPFTLFNIWGTEVLWAASYVKKVYPKEVQIICSMLNDNYGLYQSHYEWNDCIDLYLCISNRIKNNLVDLYGISERRIYYRGPFIENIGCIEKEYHMDSREPLRIGYPCRLTHGQKRADLLPELIGYLERRKVKYVLNIAGDGDCEEVIAKYVKENNLEKKVSFYGRLSRENLMAFLEKQDIYLNFSEYEGTSLTMLEAMARGCVPVVTNVSGVDDFIENRKNGLVSNVGDMENIADNILFLDQNRNELIKYGRKCAAIVPNKCDFNNYINDIEKLIML